MDQSARPVLHRPPLKLAGVIAALAVLAIPMAVLLA